METQTQQLAEGKIGKVLIKYAVPGVLSFLISSLYNIVDQIFIGHGVGFLGNGATNVIYPITVMALAFAIMVGDGAAAFLSLKLGMNQREEAERGLNSTVVLLAILGIVFMGIFLVLLKPICILFGATENILPYALDYGYIICLGIPFYMFGTGFNSCLRADGRPTLAMVSMLLGAVINTILDPLFIFVFQWGMEGAALATIMGQMATCAISIWYLPRFQSVKIRFKKLRIYKKETMRILSLGLSGFITQMAITVSMLVINRLMLKYGALSKYGADIPIAVMGIVAKVSNILVAIVCGIGLGAQPLMGFNYGAENYERVKQTHRLAVTAAASLSAVFFIVFEFFPEVLISVFGTEGELYTEFACLCFRIFNAVCLLNSFQVVTSTTFQAIGRPMKASISSLSRQLVFLVPACLILSAILGITGAMYGAVVADVLAFVLTLGMWMHELRDVNRKIKIRDIEASY